MERRVKEYHPGERAIQDVAEDNEHVGRSFRRYAR